MAAITDNSGKGPTDSSAKYKLLEQVGNGSFGVVYKAVNKDTGEVVAIKEVTPYFYRGGY
jgi:serine/threonine protein kinase